jgi:three-Cys-motif partner protein
MTKDSDPEKWIYREHTKVKHILLEKYLAAWIPILGKYNPKICYFDGFAGRGEYIDESTGEVLALGSPIIALRVADKKADYFGKLLCVFIEKNKDNYKNLEEVLEREKSKIKSWEKIEIIKENDEFANVIGQIFDYLEKEGSILVPSFFFVDPFGFSGIPFKIIKKILSNPRTEVFFTFMIRDINRFLKIPKVEEHLDALYPTSEWQEIYKMDDWQERDKALLDLYLKSLHEEAGVKYTWTFRVCMDEKYQTLYYLIHATNNFKGHSIMKSIMHNQSVDGSFAYLGPKDISERSQMRLFNIHDIKQLKRYLLEKFKGKTLTYDEIQEKVCEPWL